MRNRYTRLLPLFALVLAPLTALGQTAENISLVATDGNVVQIDRDDWGVPHITAPTEPAAFFGQGFAAAQDRLFQMETFWRASTGRLSEVIGSDGFEADSLVRVFYYTPAERQAQFETLPEAVRTMMEAYKDGVNAYIDSTTANPGTYLPVEYALPPFSLIGIEKWDTDKMVAIMQFFMRRFGEAGGEELQRLAELEANGLEWFNENRPINDPTAPTTIPMGTVAPPAASPGAYQGPPVDPSLYDTVMAQRERAEALYAKVGVPRKLGSYAAVIAGSQTTSGDVLLLGAPQMGQPQVSPPGSTNRAVTWESEILVGSEVEPALHIAGMTVPGIPGVIIGRLADRAWTLTSGVSDNVDTFAETTEDNTLTRYAYDGGFEDYEAIETTVNVLLGSPVTFTHYRSVHGPVYATDLDNQQAFTWQYTFWERELDMASAFYDLWKAESVADAEAALAQVSMSFNFFHADKDQNINFWHIGLYPDRGDADPRLPRLGDGSQEWDGLIPFEELPQDANPAQGYYVNWNNKPEASWNHGDITPWSAANDQRPRVYDGVLDLENYLLENIPLAFDEMKGLHAVVDAREYPGTYQQLLQFSETGSRAENMIPPGQSAFFNTNGLPSDHVADQWPLYTTYQMKPFTFIGAGDIKTVASEPGTPGEMLRLTAVFPNPAANSEVTVRYAAPVGSALRVEVVDVLGRTVALLADGRSDGEAEARLDTRDLASGVYVLRLTAGEQVLTRKLTVVR